jgi:hypothetical protein
VVAGDAGEDDLAGGPARVVAIASVAAAVAADSAGVCIVLTFQAAGAGMSGRLYRGPSKLHAESKSVAKAAAQRAILSVSFTALKRKVSRWHYDTSSLLSTRLAKY